MDWVSAVGQLNGISVWIFAVTEAKLFSLPGLRELRATRHKRFAQGGDIFGIEDDLRTLAARRRGAGVQSNSRSACGKLPPAFLIRDLLQART